jgi:hypothetical protein
MLLPLYLDLKAKSYPILIARYKPMLLSVEQGLKKPEATSL